MGEFPELFRAGVAIKQFVSQFGGHDVIHGAHDNADGAVVLVQVNIGCKMVEEQQPDGEDGEVILADGGEMIVRGEQEDAIDAIRVGSGQIGGRTGAEGFAHEICRLVGGEQGQGFVGGVEQTGFGWLAGAVFVAGIFEDEHVEVAEALEVVGITGAAGGGIFVAVGDQDLTFGRLVRGETFHADGLAGGIAPAFELLGLGLDVHLCRCQHLGVVEEMALE